MNNANGMLCAPVQEYRRAYISVESARPAEVVDACNRGVKDRPDSVETRFCTQLYAGNILTKLIKKTEVPFMVSFSII